MMDSELLWEWFNGKESGACDWVWGRGSRLIRVLFVCTGKGEEKFRWGEQDGWIDGWIGESEEAKESDEREQQTPMVAGKNAISKETDA